MPKFFYKVKINPQKITEGTMEAETREQVVERLQGMGYFPISVIEEVDLKIKMGAFSIRASGKIKTQDLSIFTRQLSDLLDSGLPLFKALNLIETQTENLNMRHLIGDIALEIKDGKRFSDTLQKFPKIFPALFVALVRAGEIGGLLERVLSELSDYLEREAELRSKVSAAMAYPLLMAGIGGLTIFILMSFVMPRLVNMFEDMGQILPLPTFILINISDFFSKFWWLVLVFLAIFYFILQKYLKTKEGKFSVDQISLKLPFFGGLIKKSEMSRFGRTLSTLLGNGVPMLVSLDTVIPVISNSIIRRDLEDIAIKVRQGSSLSEAISKSPHFPALVPNMIAVGEEGGVLERALLKVALAYEREVDRVIKIITSLIEPAMILVIGLIVGFIVISMLLPIFQMNLVAW